MAEQCPLTYEEASFLRKISSEMGGGGVSSVVSASDGSSVRSNKPAASFFTCEKVYCLSVDERKARDLKHRSRKVALFRRYRWTQCNVYGSRPAFSAS